MLEDVVKGWRCLGATTAGDDCDWAFGRRDEEGVLEDIEVDVQGQERHDKMNV